MEEFLKKIENFLIESGLSATMLGVKALKAPMFVFKLRQGKGCTVATMQKVEDFMNNYCKD